ncbi:MAG: cache domain-containing protein, partial [Eubacteriales bacterium]
MALWLKGLNRQILLLTLSIVMMASIVIGVLALFVFYEYSKEQVLARNQEIASGISNEVGSVMSSAMTAVESMAADKSVSGSDRVKAQAELTRLFNLTKVFDGISLIDEKGKILAFAPYKASIIGTDISQRPYVRRALKDGKPTISEPFTATTGNNVVVTASPIKDQSGKVIGVLSGSL